jgi:isopentenyl-diphosphate delta-isomerase
MGANIKESAIERLLDEVGIETDIEELYSFIYTSKYRDDLYEYELDHVFVGKYNGEIELNPEEACDAKWISLEDLAKDLLNNPTTYSTWFISCAPRVIEYLKNKRG